MTTIALFGATGKTGRHVLDQALERGHIVRALARSAEALEPRPGLTVVVGDVLDPSAVETVADGADVIISVIGHRRDSPGTLQTDGIRTIVAAMKKRGVNRIISLTGGGVPFESKDRPKIADRVLRRLLNLFSPAVLADATEHVRLLEQSALDWTVVRGPVLTDGPRTGTYRVGWVGVNSSTRISRADLADFILNTAMDGSYRHEMPLASY